VFHMAVPMMVNRRKSQNAIRDIPAGTEIKLLTIGINLQNKTVQ
jgi:hypothetical protein